MSAPITNPAFNTPLLDGFIESVITEFLSHSDDEFGVFPDDDDESPHRFNLNRCAGIIADKRTDDKAMLELIDESLRAGLHSGLSGDDWMQVARSLVWSDLNDDEGIAVIVQLMRPTSAALPAEHPFTKAIIATYRDVIAEIANDIICNRRADVAIKDRQRRHLED